MNLQQAFEQFIRANNLFSKKDHLLIAVSGGVDSVVLCSLCKEAGFTFDIAHANFSLRGSESEADEAYVRSMAAGYGTTCHVRKFDTKTFAESNRMGTQEAARSLRYAWFNELMFADNGYAYLLTAHHADDQVETVLMNFFKGTGIRGLQGMSAKGGLEPYIRRPLLFAGKQTIRQYAEAISLDYREDSSNAEDHYTRNYLRNVVIPGIEKVLPGLQSNLLNNVSRFKDIGELYRQSVDANKMKLIEHIPDGIRMPVLKLLKTPALSTIMYEAMHEFGFTAHQSEEAIKLLHSDSGKYIQSKSHRIFRNRKWLLITPVVSEDACIQLIPEGQGEVNFSRGRLILHTSTSPAAIDPSPFVAMLNAQKIAYPLLLRRWEQGDYFYPLGMKKKKKLSRFLIDQKCPVPEKEKVWVLESGQKIIWVVGMRIDDRFKISDQTTDILKITLSPV